MGYVYAIMPASLMAMLLVACEAVLTLVAALRAGRHDLQLSGAVPVMHADPGR
jgi:hypothetical protein